MMTTATKTTYKLTIINLDRASETIENISTKSAVCGHIRNRYVKGMTVIVWTSDGKSIWGGPALSFK